MDSEKLDNFFEKWADSLPEDGSFPEENENCLADYRLVEIAQIDDSKQWPHHVRGCKHCSGVVHLLRTKERPPDKLYEFINRAQKKAAEAVRADRPSVWSQLWSFTSLGQSRWAATALVASVILLIIGWWISARYASPSNDKPVIVSVGEDKYGDTVRWLQVSVNTLEDQKLSLNEKQRLLAELGKNVPQINESLKSLNSDSTKRAELANLVNDYETGITLLKDKIAAQKKAPPIQAPKLDSTADTEMVGSIYMTAHDSFLPESPGDEKKTRTEVEAAKAVQEGNKQVDVIAIKENEVEVVDLKPNRSPEEAAKLEHNLNDILGKRNIKLTLIKPPNVQTFEPRQGWSNYR